MLSIEALDRIRSSLVTNCPQIERIEGDRAISQHLHIDLITHLDLGQFEKLFVQ